MGRIWKVVRRSFVLFFDSQMRSVVVGGIIVGLLLAYFHVLNEPPGIGNVTGLMKAEADAATAHDASVVFRIYDRNAVVIDAGCQTPGKSQTWKGYFQIYARYIALKKTRFLWLRHIFAQVSWEPNNAGATAASVTAETTGVIEPSTGRRKPQFIVGHELWTFALVNRHWLVTSFTYNLCLPAYPGA
jgi:hypothetical protein